MGEADEAAVEAGARIRALEELVTATEAQLARAAGVEAVLTREVSKLQQALAEQKEAVAELQEKEKTQESQLLSLECDLAEKEEELLSWIKMDHFVCRACDTPNEVDARECPASCQLCGEIYVSDPDKAVWDTQASLQHLEQLVGGMEDQLVSLAEACGTLQMKLEVAEQDQVEKLGTEGTDMAERSMSPRESETTSLRAQLEQERRLHEDEVSSLQGRVGLLQRELESWVKTHEFKCRQCGSDNEIDGRESLCCEVCGEEFVGEADEAAVEAGARIRALEELVTATEAQLARAAGVEAVLTREVSKLQQALAEQKEAVVEPPTTCFALFSSISGPQNNDAPTAVTAQSRFDDFGSCSVASNVSRVLDPHVDIEYAVGRDVKLASSLCMSLESSRSTEGLHLSYTRETVFKTPEQLGQAFFPTSPEMHQPAGEAPKPVSSLQTHGAREGMRRGCCVVPGSTLPAEWHSNDGSPVRFRSKKNRVVSMRLTLALDYEMAGVEGSKKRRNFEDAVLNDLAKASGLRASSFRIKCLLAGSIVMHMDIVPDPSDDRVDALEVQTELERQAIDAASALRSGTMTHAISNIERSDDDDTEDGGGFIQHSDLFDLDEIDSLSAPASVVHFICVECNSPNEVSIEKSYRFCVRP